MQAWPIEIKPFNDELLSSWLIRTSLANGSDPSGLAGAIWGKWRVWTVDIDRSVPIDKLFALSQVSGMSIERLKAMTLQPIINSILNQNNLNSKQAWQWVIPTGGRNRTRINGLHFCTECLKENPVYFKRSWRLAWNTVCPKHHILLSITCPGCGFAISPHLVSYENVDLRCCVVCHHDLTQMPTIKADKSVVDLQGFLNTLVFSPSQTRDYPLGILDDSELFELLHFLVVFLHTAYKGLRSFQKLFSELDLRIEDAHFSHLPGSMFESYPVLERYFLMQAISKLFLRSRGDVIRLFVQTGVVQHILGASHGRPKIIDEACEQLSKNSRSRVMIKHAKAPIKPRSKAEVDILIDEILPFL